MAEKILVVDDDLDTLRLVGLMLERQGYKIMAAPNGRQALTLAKSQKPDLILLDLMMPDMDGGEVARQLRASPETQDILIIMFTAKSQAEDKVAGFDAGADDYLTKPTQPGELVAHVKAVLKRSRRPPVVAAKTMEERGRVVAVMAAKGGVGVSTLALNLGITLHNQFKKQVVVADFRPGCGTLGMELGYENSQGLNHLLARNPAEIGAHDVDTELVTHLAGVRFLLSSPDPQDARYANAVEHFNVIAQYLAYLAHFIVFDLGVSLNTVNEKILAGCDQVVLVLEPISSTVMQTRALINCLHEKGFHDEQIFTALINRTRSGILLSLGQVQDQLGHAVSVIFPPALELAFQASNRNTPIVLHQPDGIFTQQVVSLADKIVKGGQ
jgi:CheY-like chemotaxis protein/MinD-like ATPase involved in chromosome partitioning or flagellar assembly